MIHKRAWVDASTIGADCRVYQFASIVRGAVVGTGVTIGPGALVDGATVGDRCIVSAGALLHPGTVIGVDVFVGPGAVTCNDAWPRTHKAGWSRAQTPTVRVQDGASIGAGAIILPGVTIGAGAMVAAGAVVSRSVPARHLYGRDGAVTPIANEAAHVARRSRPLPA